LFSFILFFLLSVPCFLVPSFLFIVLSFFPIFL
jgi:hypothetical protein